MVTRADRIYEIVKAAGGRMKVAEIRRQLAKVEGVGLEDLGNVVPPTVGQDNKTRKQAGRAVRFNTFGDGTEEHGYISIVEQARLERSKGKILGDYVEQIPILIEEANNTAKKRLKEEIGKLSWREFESNFMTQVLEALGFSSIEVTQSTRDGGVDAICRYRRGIVTSEAIVSAKHWKSNRVGPDEVQRVRGNIGNQDTGIIFTSSYFTDGAIEQAKPVAGFRSIVLIDGNLIVETCFSEEIGVKSVNLPVLSEFSGFDFDEDS